MVVARLRVLNLTGHAYRLTLNPWRSWVELPPQGTVHISHALPAEGWVEFDVSERGASYHGWDGQRCDLTIGDGPGSEHRSLQPPGSPTAPHLARPRDLLAWAAALPEDFQRLRVDDYRSRPQPLVVIGPHGEARHPSGPLLMSTAGRAALEVTLRTDGDTTISTSEHITIHSRRR